VATIPLVWRRRTEIVGISVNGFLKHFFFLFYLFILFIFSRESATASFL
jgi:hypothetical protein